MTDYNPPVQEMLFLLEHVLGFQNESVDMTTVAAILEEAAKFAGDVLGPLNQVGDRHGCILENGEVKTSSGFREAYDQYRQSGWNAVPFSAEYGGQGLPWAVAFPVQEMWQGANLSFGLCPLLNQGAVEAILSHGSKDQRDYYLPRLISGEWTGTMNLTEPQAGSDLGLIRTKAERQKNGTYKISGQKIFITYGEHDMAQNIIHLVLARLPDAPEDVKGISLFIVPKFLEGGARNTLQCIGIEHKLGIHASPTCTMEFSGATGYLIGKENEGLKYMFTMMNNARLSVGLQGVAVAERAYQKALAYAGERVQGKSFSSGNRVSIIEHPDIKRMLLLMKSQIGAGRALTYEASLALDAAHAGGEAAQAKVEILTPIVKSWCTDMACEVTSLGVQIHGGMGFIEETGAAQFYRDARILPIYEGTNGIQAADLVFRKILRDRGASVQDYINIMESRVAKTDKSYFESLLQDLKTTTQWLLDKADKKEMETIAAAASSYLSAFGLIAGGALLSSAADKAISVNKELYLSKKETAEFFIKNKLPQAASWLVIVRNQGFGT